MLHAVHKYEVEIEFVKMEQVQRQFRFLQRQCEQMDKKYEVMIKQEISQLYDRQLILLQLSKRKLARFEY